MTDNTGGVTPVRLFLQRYRVALSTDGKFGILTLVGFDHERKPVAVEAAINTEELSEVLKNLGEQADEVKDMFDRHQQAQANSN